MRIRLLLLVGCCAVVATGCARQRAPQFSTPSNEQEALYAPYLVKGTSTVSGQAFLAQRGGGVVKAAGRTVTLDPATTVADDWWFKAGKYWNWRSMKPSSPGFNKARKTVLADAEGRFNFTDVPAGNYYIRTEVTWEVGGYLPTQGGLLGRWIEVREATAEDVILNAVTQ